MNTNSPLNVLICLLVALIAFSQIGCTDLSTDTEEPSSFSCDEGFPKVFGDQKFNSLQVDVYYYDGSQLEYVRSIFPRIDFPNRMITLQTPTSLTDTYDGQASIDYTIENGCIRDNRPWQRLTINDDCTTITSDIISVGVRNNGITYTDGVFDCFKPDSTVIKEAVDFFEGITTFDSVYIDRRQEELSIIE